VQLLILQIWNPWKTTASRMFHPFQCETY
jgi:hypothetical protein